MTAFQNLHYLFPHHAASPPLFFFPTKIPAIKFPSRRILPAPAGSFCGSFISWPSLKRPCRGLRVGPFEFKQRLALCARNTEAVFSARSPRVPNCVSRYLNHPKLVREILNFCRLLKQKFPCKWFGGLSASR